MQMANDGVVANDVTNVAFSVRRKRNWRSFLLEEHERKHIEHNQSMDLISMVPVMSDNIRRKSSHFSTQTQNSLKQIETSEQNYCQSLILANVTPTFVDSRRRFLCSSIYRRRLAQKIFWYESTQRRYVRIHFTGSIVYLLLKRYNSRSKYSIL